MLDNSNEDSIEKLSWEELLLKLTGKDPRVCPACGKGKMVMKLKLGPNTKFPLIMSSPPIKVIV